MVIEVGATVTAESCQAWETGFRAETWSAGGREDQLECIDNDAAKVFEGRLRRVGVYCKSRIGKSFPLTFLPNLSLN